MKRTDLEVGQEYAWVPYKNSAPRRVKLTSLGVSAGNVRVALVDPTRVRSSGEMTVRSATLVCHWDALTAWTEEQRAKREEAISDQRVLTQYGAEIASRLEAMGFKKDSTAGFRQRQVTRGGARHPQFVVSWEILWQLMQDNDRSRGGEASRSALLAALEDDAPAR